MPRIFVSYRRQDTAPFAYALKDELERRFGGGSVFIDTSSIDFGVHFPDKIAEAMGEAEVCLVLIGEQWLPPADGEGRRRWRDDDWVRREVSQALNGRSKGQLRVIPVLLRPVRMTDLTDLPDDLKGLQELNGFVLDNVSADAPRLADIIEHRHSVLEPAIVMALAAGFGVGIRSVHRWLASGPGPGEFHPTSLAVTRWFMELAGVSMYYAILVLGVLVAVRTRTGWRTAEIARVVACTALGVAAMHAAYSPLRPWIDPRWATSGLVPVWFTGAALGSAIGIHRYAPTLRVSKAQWLRLGVAVIVLGAIGSLLQGLAIDVAEAGAWLRNPRTLLWGPVLLGFAAVWRSHADKLQPPSRHRPRTWGIVVPVLLAMLVADAIGALTGPWYGGSLTPAGQRLRDAKDAWNAAIFFGLVGAVTAWRLNSAAREDGLRPTQT